MPATPVIVEESEVAKLRRQNEDLCHAISLIRSSTSWRVTAPMRGLARMFGRGRA